MAGTEQLHTSNGEAKLAVLVEQVTNLRGDVSTLGQQFTELAAALQNNQLNSTRELLAVAAQVAANKASLDNLDRKIDHKDGNSIARDQLQTTMLNREESERKSADDLLRDTVKTLAETVDRNSKALQEGAVVNRILTALAGTALGVGGTILVEWVLRGGVP